MNKKLNIWKIILLSTASALILCSLILFSVYIGTQKNAESLGIVSTIILVLGIFFIITYVILQKVITRKTHLKETYDLQKERDNAVTSDIETDSVIRLPFYHDNIQDSIYLNRKDEKFAIGIGAEYQVFDMNDVSMLKITKYKIEFWLKKELEPITLIDDINRVDERENISVNTKNALENIFSPYIYANKTNKVYNKNITVEIKKEKIKKKTCPYCGFNMNEDIDTCPKCGANQ